jgi:hypothetical protein
LFGALLWQCDDRVKKDGAQINSRHFSHQIEGTKLFGAMYAILKATHCDTESWLSTQSPSVKPMAPDSLYLYPARVTYRHCCR